MIHLTLRILFLVCFFVITHIKGSFAFASLPESGGKNYQILFGESYIDFLPGTLNRMDVIFKNRESVNLKLSQELVILDSARVKVWKTIINLELVPDERSVIQLMIPVPKNPGRFIITSGGAADQSSEAIPSHTFNVIEPKKSPRLTKILAHSPDFEEGLNDFIKLWGIKAPTISWAQVLLCGKESLKRFSEGEPVITQLIARSLRREMSVIFIDVDKQDTKSFQSPVNLPYGITMSFIPVKSQEQSFVLKPDLDELNYGLLSGPISRWNGYGGIIVPATEMRFEGKGVKINALATVGANPVRFPVVEIIPENGKGKLYLSQLITAGRLDESAPPMRYKHEIPVYDPMAVQFLLNLISASVGDNLLK